MVVGECQWRPCFHFKEILTPHGLMVMEESIVVEAKVKKI